jgi:hypothetical protein
MRAPGVKPNPARDRRQGRGIARVALAVLLVAMVAGQLADLPGNASTRAGGAAAALAVAVAWSALALSAFVSGRAIENCGCFGVYLAQPLRWWVLLEDVEFVALATGVLLAARRHAVPDAEGSFDVSASHTH